VVVVVVDCADALAKTRAGGDIQDVYGRDTQEPRASLVSRPRFQYMFLHDGGRLRVWLLHDPVRRET
jgi:hypothetical protein